jgi:hypothetical protein
MLPASPANDTSAKTNRALRRWGPLAAIVAVVAVVAAIVLIGGGDDDGDADAPSTTALSPTTDPNDSTDPGTDPDGTEPDGTDTDGTGPPPDENGTGEIPTALSFSEAQRLGIDVDWGERCDTATGRVAVPDFFAPECYAPFTGDTGGSTARGVTADSIKIVLYQGPENDPIIRYITDALAIEETNEDEADTVRGMIAYFEAFYETYGRTVELVPFVSNGIANDEVAARADAVRIAEDIQPFMVWGGPALTSAFGDELAALGVPCLSCTPSQPIEWYQDRSPYVWAIDASGQQKQAHAAEFIVEQLAGGPAEFAGDTAFHAMPRRFGLLYLESSAASKVLADGFTAKLVDGGVEVSETVAYALDPASIQQTASQAIARFKAAGVTTVLFSGDPVAPRDFTREATAQDYFPEWVLVAPALTDTNAFSRTYDQAQWANAFGVTSLAARLEPTASGYYRLYRWFNGAEPPAADQIGVLAPLPAVFYAVLQGVGPDLTPETWAAALSDGDGTRRAITQPSLAWGETGHWPFFDYHGIDDATLIWWDPDATGPDEIRRVGSGMWRFADGGTRYLPGSWPTSSGLKNAGTSVTYFESPPADEAPLDYPSPAG